MTLGALIGAGALISPMLLRDRPVNVLIVQSSESGIETVRADNFHGGSYTDANGRTIHIDRQPGWGPVATIVVNDTAHLVRILGYAYSQSGLGAGGESLIAVIPPGSMSALAVTPALATSETEPPPETISAAGPFYDLVIAQWSQVPYDAARDGTIESLRARVEIAELVYDNTDFIRP
ncbi:MAG: hypothetical protein ABJ363_10570 [Alphaproteobacteria bacterium]